MVEGQEFSNPEINIEGLPRLEHIAYQPISSKYFWSMLIRALIRLSWVTLIYFIAAYALRETIPLWVRQTIPWLLLVWWLWSFFSVYKTFKKKAFALRDKDIHYKSGWIFRRKTTIPYNRIQHCELSSGPIDRIFDLTNLQVYTAGGSHSDLSIPGLSTEVGDSLKKFILHKIGIDEEE